MSPAPIEQPAGSARSLSLGVAVVVGVMVLACVFMFTFASKNPVETVPLEHSRTP